LIIEYKSIKQDLAEDRQRYLQDGGVSSAELLKYENARLDIDQRIADIEDSCHQSRLMC
jgi:hypothetical protein